MSSSVIIIISIISVTWQRSTLTWNERAVASSSAFVFSSSEASLFRSATCTQRLMSGSEIGSLGLPGIGLGLGLGLGLGIGV